MIVFVEKYPSLFVRLTSPIFFRGRIVRERWCFGGLCPDTQEGFLVFVERRNAATLEAHIEDNIMPGSIVHSDGWKGYDR